MTLFICIIIGLWVMSRVLTWAGKSLEDNDRRRQSENEARDLAALDAAGSLRSIASTLAGPGPAPVSERITGARSDLSQRAQVKDAMEKELGVK